MKLFKGVKKIECRFYNKRGFWDMTAESSLKKGHTWEIPRTPRRMKRFLLEKFRRDLDWLKKGGMLTFAFGHSGGMSGTIITPKDLEWFKK